MKLLYKKDTKNKIRIWKIHTNGSELIQEAGLIDGKLVRNSKICISKNIGKTNETSPSDQALLELESLWKSKKDEGYFETEAEAKNNIVLLPMLAKAYEDEKHKINWNDTVYIQPKLDGMRCLAHIKANGDVTMISRDGKIINDMKHIVNDLSTIKKDIILDGELYAHGLSFQENMKLIKKYRPGQTEQIKYHVYDTVSNLPFSERGYITSGTTLQACVEVSIYKIQNEKELTQWHSIFLKEGYEGSIIRHGSDGYKCNGRSSNLLKYKDFKDIDVKIIDILPAEQRPEQGVPLLEYKGKQFQAGMKFPHNEREEWLTNKEEYIGKTAVIRFFEFTDDGVPRFPVCVGVRLDNEI